MSFFPIKIKVEENKKQVYKIIDSPEELPVNTMFIVVETNVLKTDNIQCGEN